jgi:hypothetical protein
VIEGAIKRPSQHSKRGGNAPAKTVRASPKRLLQREDIMRRLKWRKGTTTAVVIACLALVGLLGLGYWALSMAAPLQAPAPAFVVHEWGTFLSVQGSDGGAMGSMIESEEKLPEFVRERALDGRNLMAFTGKMETPVTYFYTDKPMTAQVRVDMPGGLLTHWYPAVKEFGPPTKTPKGLVSAKESFLDWGTIELIPDRPGVFPKLPSGEFAKLQNYKLVYGDNTWRFARHTDSAFVRVTGRPVTRKEGEVEKFLFYRGLSTFEMPLKVVSGGRREADESRLLHLRNTGDQPLQGLFAIEVNQWQIRYASLDDLPGGESRTIRHVYDEKNVDNGFLGEWMHLDDGIWRVKRAVADRLVKAGLYRAEAEAMVNTWEHSYFKTQGFRFLYILPRQTVDNVIPIHITPKPDELARVMVGRVEVLTPEKERSIEEAVLLTASKDEKKAQEGRNVLGTLGRLHDPVLLRVAATSNDGLVKTQVAALLKERQEKAEKER